MTSPRPSSNSDEWAQAIGGDLVDRLDLFAFEREKILDKLDIRAAKAARTLSMELRSVRRSLASVPRDLEDPQTIELMDQFQALRAQAEAVLGGRLVDTVSLARVSSVPPKSGERGPGTPPPFSQVRDDLDDIDDPDEITAARTPESLRKKC